jgi:ubiquinone/menaquinone biosynthesis C-methylase UbiE
VSYLTAYFYDRFMAKAEEACLKEWRHGLLKQVSGDVLEIGAGTGASINLYPQTITRLVLSEPDKHMRKRLEVNAVNSHVTNISITSATAEHIDADDESFDFVVASLVCCSLTNLEAGLLEIKRVLKPGGGLVFLEHVAAADGTGRRWWQNRINPLWRGLMGNCNLNRETEHAMLSAGFSIVQITRESMRKAMPLVRPTIRGVAKKA